MKKTLSIVMSILMAMAFAAVSVTTPVTVSAASAPGALYAYDDADDVDGEGIDDYDDDGRYADGGDSDGDMDGSDDVDDIDDTETVADDTDDNNSDDGDEVEDIPEEYKYFVITGERSNYGSRFWPSEMDDNGQRFQMYDNASGYRFYIDTNGGQLLVDASGDYTIAYPSFRSAERSEWKLDHWNTYPDDSGEVFMPGETVSMERLEEIGTIYAIWKKTETDASNENDPTVIHRPPYVLTITDEYIQIYNEETDAYLAVQTYHAEMGYEWDDAEGAYTQEFDGGVDCCDCPVCEHLGYAQHSNEESNAGNDRGSSEPENQTGEEPEEEPGEEPGDNSGEEPSGDPDDPDTNSADAPTVCVQGVELDEGNNAGSGWSYDEASNTLTLDNFTYTGTGLFVKPESGEEDPGDDGEDPADDPDGEEGVDGDDDWNGEEGVDDDDDWDGEEGDDADDPDDEGEDPADDPDSEGEDPDSNQVKGVICSDGDLTLKLNGESSISVIDLDSDASYGINVAGELKIEGDGFLTVKSIKETKTYGEKKEDVPEGEDTANRGEGDTNSNDNSADNNQNANRGDTNQNVTGGDTNQNVTAGDNNQTVNGGNSSALSNSSIGDINNYVSNNPYISPYIVVEETPCHMCAYRNTGCGKRPHEYCRTDASPKTGDEDAAGLLGSLIAAAACIITAAIVLIRRWRYSR